jgi:hypothetical protein
VPAATPAPLVEVKPAREIRTLSPVNEVAVDGGRAATLVGAARAWEYLLVWTPKGVVVRATLNCDLQESSVVLAGNRFGHVCFQNGVSYVVTGTLKPLRARIALQTTSFVSLAGGGTLVAGSNGRAIWRFDLRSKQLLERYPAPAVALAAGADGVLVEHDRQSLDVLSRTGRLVARRMLPHDGGALLRSGRIATISKRRLLVTNLRGRRVLARTVAGGARLEDFNAAYAVYAVETRLHVVRLRDGRDVALRLRGQFGYASAQLSGGQLFYAYNAGGGKTGRAGVVDVAGLFGG